MQDWITICTIFYCRLHLIHVCKFRKSNTMMYLSFYIIFDRTDKAAYYYSFFSWSHRFRSFTVTGYSWPESVGFMLNSGIFLFWCIFNGESRWETFFIATEFSVEQKRHREPQNKCIYADHSVCGMYCVPNRFQIVSFVNIRPFVISTDAFRSILRMSFTPCMMRSETGTRSLSFVGQSITIFSVFLLKDRRKYPCQIRWDW